MTVLKTQAVAFEFARILREWLTSKEMKVVLRRNKMKENKDKDCCATHDFCDPNMAMLEAFALVHNIPEAEIDLEDEAVCQRIKEAWAIAKATEFDPARIIPPNISLHF